MLLMTKKTIYDNIDKFQVVCFSASASRQVLAKENDWASFFEAKKQTKKRELK